MDMALEPIFFYTVYNDLWKLFVEKGSDVKQDKCIALLCIVKKWIVL
jgi:hypothetical protein